MYVHAAWSHLSAYPSGSIMRTNLHGIAIRSVNAAHTTWLNKYAILSRQSAICEDTADIFFMKSLCKIQPLSKSVAVMKHPLGQRGE